MSYDVRWPKRTMSYTRNKAVRTTGVMLCLEEGTLYRNEDKHHDGTVVAILPINSRNETSKLFELEIPTDKIPELAEALIRIYKEARDSERD